MLLKELTQWNIGNVMIRIIVSMILGAIIGIDRGAKKRGGGARTTMTVCLGATMVMLMEQFFQHSYPGETEPTRMAAQVISGVGFLGAGSILISGHQIKGLTSAASIWTCACIGLAVGCGLIDIAAILTLLWVIGLHLIPPIEDFFQKRSRYVSISVEVESGKAISAVIHKIRDDGCVIDIYDVDKPKAKGQFYSVMTTIRLPRNTNADEYMQSLRELKGVVTVDEM